MTDHANDISEARDKLLAVLKLILNNDQVAADYVLLNLLSRVHTRKDGLLLGNFAINLSNVSPQKSKLLTRLIEELMPLSLYFKLSLDSLQNTNFTPKKNYDTNLLEPGLL